MRRLERQISGSTSHTYDGNRFSTTLIPAHGDDVRFIQAISYNEARQFPRLLSSRVSRNLAPLARK